MAEQDPYHPIDIDSASVEGGGLQKVVASLQSAIQGLQAKVQELESASEAESLSEFQAAGLRLRAGKGILLQKRGANSYDISLAKKEESLIEQVSVITEYDNHLECRRPDGSTVEVMKPFELQRKFYEDIESNTYSFSRLYDYTYIDVNKRKVTLRSDTTQEEYHIITRDYPRAYILAVKLPKTAIFQRAAGIRGEVSRSLNDYPWVDLNITGRAWAVDPNGGA